MQLRMLAPLVMAIVLAAMPGAARAAPFDDARDYIIAGKVGDALMIIDIGAMNVNERDDAGYTLLDYAAKSGSLEGVRKLLDQGADPTLAAKDGMTAAALASTPEIRAELAAAVSRRTQARPGAQ